MSLDERVSDLERLVARLEELIDRQSYEIDDVARDVRYLESRVEDIEYEAGSHEH